MPVRACMRQARLIFKRNSKMTPHKNYNIYFILMVNVNKVNLVLTMTRRLLEGTPGRIIAKFNRGYTMSISSFSQQSYE